MPATDNAPNASKQNPSPRIKVLNAVCRSPPVSVLLVQTPTMKQMPTNANSENIIIAKSLMIENLSYIQYVYNYL